MTQQFPLFLAAPIQLKGQQHRLQGSHSMGVAVHQLAHQLPVQMAAPFTQQDLLAWMLSSKLATAGRPNQHQQAGPSLLSLDATALANELNSCGSQGTDGEHVVPQAAPRSPASTLDVDDWRSPALEAKHAAAPQCPEATPATPDLQFPPQAAAMHKRKFIDYEMMPVAPRTHRRKNLHPARAAEAVADDWESRASPARSSPPPAPRRQDLHSRFSPERIHRKPAVKAMRKSPAAMSDTSTMVKECHDCHTLKTPMWRRVEGLTFCNACGLRRTRALVGR